ncbi:hypothetical protein B0H13DRAFT_2266036 [Mycena leptocephala]|nr:hypothetical protein B0H13DRAFT_2266036 [Mycena leptocephala]
MPTPLAVLCRPRSAMLVVATVVALYPGLSLDLDRFLRHPDPRLPSAPASYTQTPRVALSPQLVATRRKMYTDYEMVRKRYSDFVAFRDIFLGPFVKWTGFLTGGHARRTFWLLLVAGCYPEFRAVLLDVVSYLRVHPRIAPPVAVRVSRGPVSAPDGSVSRFRFRLCLRLYLRIHWCLHFALPSPSGNASRQYFNVSVTIIRYADIDRAFRKDGVTQQLSYDPADNESNKGSPVWRRPPWAGASNSQGEEERLSLFPRLRCSFACTAGVRSEDRNKPLGFASSFGSRGAAVEDTRYVDLDIVSPTSLWGEMRLGVGCGGSEIELLVELLSTSWLVQSERAGDNATLSECAQRIGWTRSMGSSPLHATRTSCIQVESVLSRLIIRLNVKNYEDRSNIDAARTQSVQNSSTRLQFFSIASPHKPVLREKLSKTRTYPKLMANLGGNRVVSECGTPAVARADLLHDRQVLPLASVS